MFEDATFETMSRIHTRSLGWMVATFAFNSSILLAMAIIPILHPEMLPQITNPILMQAPVQEAQKPKPVVRTQQEQTAPSEIKAGVVQAPSVIPKQPYIPGKPEEPLPGTVIALGGPGPGTGIPDNPFNGHGTYPDVRPAVEAPRPVSSGVMEGMLIHKVVPEYPAVARTMHVAGAVVLQATISRSGTIENLHVASGPALLQQAALDAVRQWRYRPYLLSGQPVEVETTVSVEFTLE
ncbi:MAG: TonB family protein [Terracidiphilus sp.]